MKRMIIMTSLIAVAVALAFAGGANASFTRSCGRLTANTAGLHHFAWAKHIKATGLTCHAAKHALRRSHWTHRGHFHARGYRCHIYSENADGARFKCGRNSGPRHHYFRFLMVQI